MWCPLHPELQGPHVSGCECARAQTYRQTDTCTPLRRCTTPARIQAGKKLEEQIIRDNIVFHKYMEKKKSFVGASPRVIIQKLKFMHNPISKWGTRTCIYIYM